MPFKMMGKSPLMKKLVGKQGKLPENLIAAIKKSSPGKMQKPSPAKVGETQAMLKSLARGLNPIKAGSKKDEKKDEKKEVKPETKNQNKFDSTVGRTKSGKLTYSQAYKNASASVKAKYGNSEAAFTKAAKEYNAKQKVKTPEVKKQAATTNTTTTTKPSKVGFSVGSASASLGGDRKGGTPGVSTVKVGGSGGAKATFGKKVVNRPGGTFTDEFGNTYNRSVKGRKKDDGSVSKTVTNKRNDDVTSQKDVTKGPKVKGKRRTKTVTKTKFTGSGTPRVVTKTRGPGGRKRTVLGDNEAKAKVAELKKRREERDNSPTKLSEAGSKKTQRIRAKAQKVRGKIYESEIGSKKEDKLFKKDEKLTQKLKDQRDKSPTKMKTKTPNKMMKKSPNKMMKKAAAPKMMKKVPAKMMKKKKK